MSDSQILEAYSALARLEGVFAEPASAAPVAGLKQLASQGYFTRSTRIVVTLTGNGLKDPETAIRLVDVPESPVPAERSAVLSALGYE